MSEKKPQMSWEDELREAEKQVLHAFREGRKEVRVLPSKPREKSNGSFLNIPYGKVEGKIRDAFGKFTSKESDSTPVEVAPEKKPWEESWDEDDWKDVKIRAGFLYDLLLSKSLSELRRGHSNRTEIHNAWIEGRLDMPHCESNFQLAFSGCIFSEGLSLEGATIPQLELVECEVYGNVDLRNADIRNGFNSAGAHFRRGSVEAEGLKTNGSVLFDCQKHKYREGDGFDYGRESKVEGRVNLCRANIGGDLKCVGHFKGGLNAGNLKTGGDVRLVGEFGHTAVHDDDIWRTNGLKKFDEGLNQYDLYYGWFGDSNESLSVPPPVDLHNADIGGCLAIGGDSSDVSLSPIATLMRTNSVVSAIDRIPRRRADDFSASYCRLRELENGDMLARIRAFSGGTPTPSEMALDKIKNNLVDQGKLNKLNDAEADVLRIFKGEDVSALDQDKIDNASHALLRIVGDMFAQYQDKLNDAKAEMLGIVEDMLDPSQAILLNLNNAKADVFRMGEDMLHPNGRWLDKNYDPQFDRGDAHDSGDCEFVYDNPQYVVLGVEEDEDPSGSPFACFTLKPRGLPCVSANGFRYQRIENADGGDLDINDGKKWLELMPKGQFQSHEQLLKVYRRMGEVTRDMGYDLQHARVKAEFEDGLRLWHWKSIYKSFKKIWYWILRWTCGYGYKPFRFLGLITVMLALGVGLFSNGHCYRFNPSHESALAFLANKWIPSTDGGLKHWNALVDDKGSEVKVGESAKKREKPPANYLPFNPWVYSIEAAFPILNLGLLEKWHPSNLGLLWVRWVMTIIGSLLMGVMALFGVGFLDPLRNVDRDKDK